MPLTAVVVVQGKQGGGMFLGTEVMGSTHRVETFPRATVSATFLYRPPANVSNKSICDSDGVNANCMYAPERVQSIGGHAGWTVTV